MQDRHTIDDHLKNNTPFVQNNSSEIETTDLQFIFKNEDNEARITHLYTTAISSNMAMKLGRGIIWVEIFTN